VTWSKLLHGRLAVIDRLADPIDRCWTLAAAAAAPQPDDGEGGQDADEDAGNEPADKSSCRPVSSRDQVSVSGRTQCRSSSRLTWSQSQ
jgi:hypothetical protein